MMNTKPSPVSAPTLYTPTLLHAYPRVTALTDSIYSPAGYVNTQGYLPFGPAPDSSAFYAPLNADCGDAWRSLSAQTAAAAAAAAAAWVYEPTMVGYPYPTSYGNLDVRRKNATRESTSTLKAWLYEHIKNPYPTKGEKIMLAIITKMTLTQVSTWFANARRRLKKENKMQWSPRNRTGDDDDDDDDKNSDNDDVIIGDRSSEREENAMMMNDDEEDIVVDAGNEDSHPGNSDRSIDVAPVRCYPITDDTNTASPIIEQRPECIASRPDPETHRGYNIRTLVVAASGGGNDSTSGGDKHGGCQDLQSTGSAIEKPRIWSLADVATSSTPSSVYRQRSSPSAASELPVRTNHLLSQHRYAHDIPQSPAAPLPSSAVHHSFQPWTKRFLSGPPMATPSVHHFSPKLIPGYVPYLGLGAQGFRQEPCAVTCNGVDANAARSHAPISGVHVAGAAAVGAVSSSVHPLDFAKVLTNGLTPDDRTANPSGKYSGGYIIHPSALSSSCSSSSSSTLLSNSSSSSSTSSPKSSPICSSSSSSSFSSAAAAETAASSSSSSCHLLVPPLMLSSASSQTSEKRS